MSPVVQYEFTPEIAATICERIADGESLRSICKGVGMPSKGVVLGWLGQNKDFADQYARAREIQADSYVDDIVDIADKTNLKPEDKRVQIDARKWAAGKLRPKKYGDKVALVGGGKDDEPIRHQLDPTNLTDEQLAALAGILGAAPDPGPGPGGDREAEG